MRSSKIIFKKLIYFQCFYCKRENQKYIKERLNQSETETQQCGHQTLKLCGIWSYDGIIWAPMAVCCPTSLILLSVSHLTTLSARFRLVPTASLSRYPTLGVPPNLRSSLQPEGHVCSFMQLPLRPSLPKNPTLLFNVVSAAFWNLGANPYDL